MSGAPDHEKIISRFVKAGYKHSSFYCHATNEHGEAVSRRTGSYRLLYYIERGEWYLQSDVTDGPINVGLPYVLYLLEGLERLAMPNTLDGILRDMRERNTPRDDKYGGKDTGVFLYNCGWVAYHGDCSTVNLFDDTFETAYEAAAALWRWYNIEIWSKIDAR